MHEIKTNPSVKVFRETIETSIMMYPRDGPQIKNIYIHISYIDIYDSPLFFGRSRSLIA